MLTKFTSHCIQRFHIDDVASGTKYLPRDPSWGTRLGLRGCAFKVIVDFHNFISIHSISFRDLLCSVTICRFAYTTLRQRVFHHSPEINSFPITSDGIILKTRAAECSTKQVGSVLWRTGTRIPVGNAIHQLQYVDPFPSGSRGTWKPWWDTSQFLTSNSLLFIWTCRGINISLGQVIHEPINSQSGKHLIN